MGSARLQILVLSSLHRPWRHIQIRGQDATWIPDAHAAGVNVVRYLYAQTESDRMNYPDSRNHIWYPPSAVEPSMHARLRHALQEIWREDWDFLFRTNVSTWVNTKLLLASLPSPNTVTYSGVMGTFAPSKCAKRIRFASGAGILMSRHVAELLAFGPNQDSLNESLAEDVAIGQQLSSEVPLTPLRRLDVHSVRDSRRLLPMDISKAHSVRCKVLRNPRVREVLEPRVFANVQQAFQLHDAHD